MQLRRAQPVSRRRPLVGVALAAALVLSACGSAETVASAPVDAVDPAVSAAATTEATEPVTRISIQATTTVGESIDVVPADKATLLWFWAPW